MGFFPSCEEGGGTLHYWVWVSLCDGFSRCAARASQHTVAAHRLSCFVACGIFPYQGLNLCLLHCQADSLPLNHQESPIPFLKNHLKICIILGQVLWLFLANSSSVSFNIYLHYFSTFFFFFWLHHVPWSKKAKNFITQVVRMLPLKETIQFETMKTAYGLRTL